MSLVLGILPFVAPAVPIFPLIFVNWVLFMLVGYWASPKPMRWLPPFQKMEPPNFKVLGVALVAFAVAGWIAIFHTPAIV